jgi:hypothetical protein
LEADRRYGEEGGGNGELSEICEEYVWGGRREEGGRREVGRREEGGWRRSVGRRQEENPALFLSQDCEKYLQRGRKEEKQT